MPQFTYTPPDPLDNSASTLSIYVTELQDFSNIKRAELGQSALTFIDQTVGEAVLYEAIEELKEVIDTLAVDFGYSGIEDPALLGRPYVAHPRFLSKPVIGYEIINDLRQVLNLLGEAQFTFNMYAIVVGGSLVSDLKTFSIDEFAVTEYSTIPAESLKFSPRVKNYLQLGVDSSDEFSDLIAGDDFGYFSGPFENSLNALIRPHFIENKGLPVDASGEGAFAPVTPNPLGGSTTLGKPIGVNHEYLFLDGDDSGAGIIAAVPRNNLYDVVDESNFNFDSDLTIAGTVLSRGSFVTTGYVRHQAGTPGPLVLIDGSTEEETYQSFISVSSVSGSSVSKGGEQYFISNIVDRELNFINPLTGTIIPSTWFIEEAHVVNNSNLTIKHESWVGEPIIDPDNGDIYCGYTERLKINVIIGGYITGVNSPPPLGLPPDDNRYWLGPDAVDGPGAGDNDNWSEHIGQYAVAVDLDEDGFTDAWIYSFPDYVTNIRTALIRFSPGGGTPTVVNISAEVSFTEDIGIYADRRVFFDEPFSYVLLDNNFRGTIVNGLMYGIGGYREGHLGDPTSQNTENVFVLDVSSGSYLEIEQRRLGFHLETEGDYFKIQATDVIPTGADPECPNLNAGDLEEFYVKDFTSGHLYDYIRDGNEALELPDPPVLLSAVRNVAGTECTLTWTAVPGAISYYIYRDGNGSSNNRARYRVDDLLAEIPAPATSHLITGITAGEAEFYSVTVRTANGNSQLSNVIRSSRSTSAPVLTVTGLGEGVQLNWTAVAGATTYFVEYKNVYDSILNLPVRIDVGNVLTHTIASLSTGGTFGGTAEEALFDFRVFASFSGGLGDTSPDSTLIRTCPKLEVPVLTSAVPGGTGEVDLNWTAVTGATSYAYRSKLSTATVFDLPVDVGNVTNATFVGTPGLSYDFVVFAKNGIYESIDSNQLTSLAGT